MIKFSRREDYAVILVNKLAEEYNKRVVPLSEVAEEFNISLLFLRNLANDLRNAKIIKALEGKSGGYTLVKDPSKLKMGEVLSVFSNQLVACCPKNNDKKHARVCPKQEFCITGNVWRKLNKEFLDKVYNLSLTEFIAYK